MHKSSLLIPFIVIFALVTQGESKKNRGIMTWYSFTDNKSNIGSFDNTLVVFKSVARSRDSNVPLRTKIFIPLLKGFPMGNGKIHDGYVRVDDDCRGGGCKYLDLYVGSNAQRDRYRKWMSAKCRCDADQLKITAFYYR